MILLGQNNQLTFEKLPFGFKYLFINYARLVAGEVEQAKFFFVFCPCLGVLFLCGTSPATTRINA